MFYKKGFKKVLAVGFLIVGLFLAGALIPTAAQTGNSGASVEDQYWDAVKNSTNIDDFKSYLKEYPTGKYAAIARFKINQQSVQTNNPQNSVSLAFQRDVEYLNKWAAEVRVGLPEAVGEFQLTNAISQCPNGCQEQLDPGDGNELALIFKTTRFDRQSDFTNQVIPALKPILLPEYCKNEGMKKNIRLAVFVLDGNEQQINNFFIFPKDCSVNVSTNTSQNTNGRLSDTQFLNNWAADVRVGLPETLGEFQLMDGKSRCPAGCEESDSVAYLLLSFKAPHFTKQDVTITQVEQELKPLLYKVYCQSEGRRRNIMLGVFVRDMNQITIGNFWVYPADCT